MSGLYERLVAYPPILCRILARHPYGAPLTTEELVQASGLNHLEVEALSQQTTWDGVEVFTVQAFTRACRVDFDNHSDMRRVGDYLKKSPGFRYLRAAPNYKTYYAPLLKRWRRSYGILTPETPIPEPHRALLIRLNPLLK